MKSLKIQNAENKILPLKFLISLHPISRTFYDEKLWHPPALLSYTMNLLTGLPRIIKDEQIDLIVKFWERPLVVTRYWESKFLSHATAADVQKTFNEGMERLPCNKMCQVGMDGPNDNLKMYKR